MRNLFTIKIDGLFMAGRTVYIAGAGHVSHQHAEARERLPDEAELAVADPDREAREQFGADFPDARLYADVEAMLEEPVTDGDIFVVATPPFVRRDLAIAGFESNRHVLCEKPLAMNYEEAIDILRAAREHDRLLGVATSRYLGSSHTEAVSRYVDDGTLGSPYHATFVDRLRRKRTGIEYQPESRWPLDSSKSGGGILMNWGNYDFAVLTDVLAPRRVDVIDAWVTAPETDLDLPVDVTNDVEQHAGATLHYHLRDGTTVTVTYERSDCTHGTEHTQFEIEGTEAAVRWDWKETETPSLTIATDEDNEPREEEISFARDEDMSVGNRPLVFFDRARRGEDAPQPTNERAVFDFACIRSIYDCAETGERQSVTLEDI